MGSSAHLVVVGGDEGATDRAIARIEQLESRWSRFRPDSEVCAMNRAAGTSVAVSPDTTLLVRRAIDGWRLSGGSYDPTLLGPLIAAGYDSSFELLPDVADRQSESTRSPFRVDRPGCTDIVIDDDRVTIPVGVGFDAGGIGKGLAADLVATELIEAGALGACVNLGGDVRVMGIGPTGATWTVAIEHPSAGTLALVGLAAGAVATSSTLRRVWSVDDERRHHLIDPATGEPSATDLELASVVSGQAWIAEVLAKAALLRGADRAFDLIDAANAAMVVDGTGRVVRSTNFATFIGHAPLMSQIEDPRLERMQEAQR